MKSGEKSHQNHKKVMLGGPSEEVVFTDQQLGQTGVRAALQFWTSLGADKML